MSEHQGRIWARMIEGVRTGIKDHSSLGSVLRALEASMDAADFKNADLVREFYDLFVILETHYACSLEFNSSADPHLLSASLENMKLFLERRYCYVKSL